MKCPNCGKQNPEGAIYCVDCREHIKKALSRGLNGADFNMTSETTRLDAQVSNAINIRRVTLVAILAVIVTVGTTLVTLISSVFVTDRSDAVTLLKIWLGFAVLITIVGVFAIIFNKRLTQPN
ncbi:MAG: zinc-ribbon domain-containing protein [Candidatus Thermoplasmatota archaeon]|nr:zinc-ribbon domain-containing protein [Candidatus Thermoplasmatota archaeon]